MVRKRQLREDVFRCVSTLSRATSRPKWPLAVSGLSLEQFEEKLPALLAARISRTRRNDRQFLS